ncbi:MAG: glucokinase [Burkholderiaceae bacterium]
MSTGFPRLLGDIGGTNARWAWHARSGAAIQDVSVRPCAANATLYESAAAYLAEKGHPRPAWVGIGIATPVASDRVQLTNNDWAFSITELKQALGAERCLVINDFTALAMSLTALAPSDLRAVGAVGAVGASKAVAGAPMALLGPGTGLGVSGLLPQGDGRWWAVSGEGGHVTLAATDEHEAALLALVRRRFGHASAERVLSGSGLVNLYGALCALSGTAERALQPSDVTDAALDGSDPLCAQAVQRFTAFLGNAAGNLALTLGAHGGVYIGGGIVPRLGAHFDGVLFRQHFEAKGRFADYLKAIPTSVITAAAPALIGASNALDLMPA